MKKLKIILMLTSSLFFSQLSEVKSAEEYNNLTCVVGLRTEQLCNIAIHKRSMVIKFPTGRTEIIKLHKIGKWGYTNESKLKGFIFTWVKHRHVFGISYKNIDGDKEQMAIAFNDSQYVQPFKFFLKMLDQWMNNFYLIRSAKYSTP